MRNRGSLISSSSSRFCSLKFSTADSANESLSNYSSHPIDCKMTRCEGLDLLVKAALHVSGEFFFEAPFDQRKVTRRRRRRKRSCSSNFGKTSLTEEPGEEEEEEEEMTKDGEIDVISKPKRRKRVMALPSKYNDSVLQPWKRRTRPKRSVESG